MSFLTVLLGALALSAQVWAAPRGKFFDRAVFVIFENKNYSDVITQPFFKQLANSGAHFTNFTAITHPSQGNYIALTSGSLNGVTGDGRYDINVDNIADLLESKGLSWKVYIENYPGSCYTGMSSSGYARKHNPFISYVSIQKNPTRCARIVNANEFDRDAQSGHLPNYVFYVPNIQDDGHDTSSAYADKWYQGKFSNYLSNPDFMKDTILISTFDESGFSAKNQIYTSVVGPAIKVGVYSPAVNHYSVLRLIEENWALGSLGKEDAKATPIPSIWN